MFLLETVAVANANGATAGTFTITADIAKLFTSINWASPTWDLFIVLFFIVTVFLYGMSMGRDRIIVILVSIYIALAIISNAPFLGKLNASITLNQHIAFRVTTFIGLFLVLFFLMSRSALLRTFGNLAAGSWWQVLIFSTFHVGLLVSITLGFLPPDAVKQLAPFTQSVFASETARFVWIVMPVVGMALVKG